jgi:hypothetical protein
MGVHLMDVLVRVSCKWLDRCMQLSIAEKWWFLSCDCIVLFQRSVQAALQSSFCQILFLKYISVGFFMGCFFEKWRRWAHGIIGTCCIQVERWTWLGNQVLYPSDQTRVRTPRLGRPDIVQSFVCNSIDMKLLNRDLFLQTRRYVLLISARRRRFEVWTEFALGGETGERWRERTERHRPYCFRICNGYWTYYTCRYLTKINLFSLRVTKISGPRSVLWWSWVYVYSPSRHRILRPNVPSSSKPS